MGGFKDDLYPDEGRPDHRPEGSSCKPSSAWAEESSEKESPLERQDTDVSGISRDTSRDLQRKPTFRRQLSNIGDVLGGGLVRFTRSLTMSQGPSYLDSVLGQEFSGAAESESYQDDDADDDERVGDASSATGSQASERRPSVTSAGAKEFTAEDLKAWGGRVVEKRWFTSFFMVLTFYALYVPDVDLWLGNKESRFAISITTTIVSFCFLIEIVLQVLGKANYACRPYFWLDLVSFISLLPDTYLIEVMTSNNAFVAGRSSRLTRILFLARSSRAARLNRLGRIVRVVAMLPRLQRLVSRGAKDVVTDRLLDKKLQRIFHFLDEDMDGYVSREPAERCLAKIRMLTSTERGKVSWAGQMARHMARHASLRSPTATSEALRNAAAVTSPKPAPSPPTTPSSQADGQICEDLDLVNLDMFRAMVLEDMATAAGLRKACKQQILQSNNMINVTARNSEYIGVKIALFVLLLLFAMSFMMQNAEDLSSEYGVNTIDRLVRQHLPAQAVGSTVPMLVQNQVREWIRSDPYWLSDATKLLYLDLNKRVYCNDFTSSTSRCTLHNSSQLVWSTRTSMGAIDDDLYASHYRIQDMVLIRVPDLSHLDISTEEFERQTTAVAVLDGRSSIQGAARNSVLTTSSVILIILVGIALVTRDLAFLSRNLLKPLVELADEMESASRLQLAGLSSVDDALCEQGLSEIRLIRRTFENMKKAIKNWGKYVPWQVVQALLRKDTHVNIEVKETEVSIFFSDIANFTSIVEGLPPEKSLLLLSRYFHDMSKIMDEYGGIVIEFIGDAILGIYGAPVANEEHPTAAVKSAIRMIDQLETINKWLAERSLPSIQIRCGLHTGRALVGNMGFHSRMKYGIVGEEAEIPSRLEEMNKTYSTKLLISQAMCGRLVPDTFVMRPIDFAYLGSEQSTMIYEVLERNRCDRRCEKENLACARHTAALELYRTRDFAQAKEQFEEVKELMERVRRVEDVPAALMIKRCRSYLDCPPPPDWEGVWDRGDLP